MPRQETGYIDQLARMMYGLGDSQHPNPSTVRLVESIVLQQLQTIAKEALKYADDPVIVKEVFESFVVEVIEKKPLLKGEHLVFLMRHNKHKMQRFVKYITTKQLSQQVQSRNLEVSDFDLSKTKRHKLLDFIESIDETGEFMDTSTIDDIKLKRMIRAERIAQELSQKKYMEFQKARCTSFRLLNVKNNLKQWIDPQDKIDFSEEAVEVLTYMANQTVAEIVDCALLVREDSRIGTDPFAHIPGSYYSATMFTVLHTYKTDDEPHTYKPNDESRIHLKQSPITVDEVKEVMRRIYNPQAGVLNFGRKLPETRYMFAL